MSKISLSSIEQKLAYDEKNNLCLEEKKIGKWWGKTYFRIDVKNNTLRFKTLSIIGIFFHLFGYKKSFHRNELSEYLKANNIKLPRLQHKKTGAVLTELALKLKQPNKKYKNTIESLRKLLLGFEIKNEEEIINLFNNSDLNVDTPISENRATALYLASRAGCYNLCAFLVGKNANVNFNATANSSTAKTPLQAAIYNQDEALIKLLLENGADVNSKNAYDYPILHQAMNGVLREKPNKSGLIIKGSKGGDAKKILQLILEKKPEINAVDKQGKTALHVAAEVDDAEIVEWLLDAGADPSLTDDKGQTALEIAREKGNEIVVKLLETRI